jgi:hypothetical protein
MTTVLKVVSGSLTASLYKSIIVAGSESLFRSWPMNTKIIAYATVIQKPQSLPRSNPLWEALDSGLHTNPDILRDTLHTMISNVSPTRETINLEYELCSQAVVGLENAEGPGTYNLTKGWDKPGRRPSTDRKPLAARCGEAKAGWLVRDVLRDYVRPVLLNTEQYGLERYRIYADRTAVRFGLGDDEGPRDSTALLRRTV